MSPLPLLERWKKYGTGPQIRLLLVIAALQAVWPGFPEMDARGCVALAVVTLAFDSVRAALGELWDNVKAGKA